MPRTAAGAVAVQGDVVQIKRRGIHRDGRHHGRRFHRGRRHHDGVHWYFWAPLIGTYLYYQSYDACYRSCRNHGYSHNYCTDHCAF
jgi:hypothetical protein